MKVILVITGLRMGGAENQVCDLADKLHELGNEVMIISLLKGVEVKPKNLEIQLEELNVNAYNIPRCIVEFISRIRLFKPDVVHSHLFHAIVFSRISRLFVAIPKLISTHHGMRETTSFRRSIFKITDFLDNFSTAVSAKAAKSFASSNSKASSGVKIVYNGIDLVRFKFSEEKRVELRTKLEIAVETKVILAVGRLVWEKDYTNLIDSFVIASGEISGLSLMIIGDGPMREELVYYVEQLNIASRVKFLGKRTDTDELYNIADIVVSSSVREGFGLVLVEAMACERSVVATNCGIADEFDKNLVDFVKPKSPDLLAKAIIVSLSRDTSKKNSNHKRSLEFVSSKFSMDNIVLDWLELYKS